MLGVVVVSTVLCFCFLSSASSADAKTLQASFARDTSLEAAVVGRETRRLNEKTREWEEGYFLTFEALDGRKIINDGELKVPRSVFVRAHRGEKGKLSLDKEGRLKRFTVDYSFS